MALKLNKDKIKEKKQELYEFEGWLPFRFYNYISPSKRFDYLESIGLYDKIQKQNAKYRRMLMDSDNPDELMDELILKFVIENPEFQDLIIQE